MKSFLLYVISIAVAFTAITATSQLVALKNAMNGNALPYDAEVQYLISTGTQYIDTGVRPAAGYGMSCTFALIRVQNDLDPIDHISNGIMGTMNDKWAGYGFCLCTYYESGNRIWGIIGDGSSSYLDWDIYTNNVYTAEFNFLDSSNQTFNDEVLGNVTSEEKQQCNDITGNIFLFAVSSNEGMEFTCYGIIRMYGAKISSGNTVIHDYIPVRVGTQGYMFDKITKKLLGNGNLICGPDKEYRDSLGVLRDSAEYVVVRR